MSVHICINPSAAVDRLSSNMCVENGVNGRIGIGIRACASDGDGDGVNVDVGICSVNNF